MASNTDNLQLYKKDPLTDGNDTFDIQTMMNDNWDKIDAELGAQVVASPAKTPVSLVSGQQVITSPRVAPYNVKSIKGRTLVNLLGRAGNCEDASKWQINAGTITLDATNKTTGNNGFRVTGGNGSNYGQYLVPINYNPAKYYIILADVKAGNTNDISVRLFDGIAGIRTSRTTAIADKFTTVFAKAAPNTLSGSNTVYADIIVAGDASVYAYIDAFRVYEITAAEYAALDSMTPAQVAAKYPYVDDVKPVMNPYAIKYGENLFPTFYELYQPALNGLVPNITGPYDASFVTSAVNQFVGFLSISFVPGQAYTVSAAATTGMLQVYVNQIDNTGAITQTKGALPFTFTPNANTVQVGVYFGGDVTGSFSVSKPMLNLGDTALPFKPREDDYLIFPARLHSNIDRSVYDEITYRDGQYWKNSRFGELELDGSLPWTPNDTFTGLKQIKVPITNFIKFDINAKVTKYDGKILNNETDQPWQNSHPSDSFNIWSDGVLYLSIPGADSGWGDGYTPTQAEIQAYFNGWKMYTQGGNTWDPYNGTGTKAWVKVIYKDNNNAVDTTLTLPTDTYAEYKPYKLIYQLATPTTEVIPAEGGITLPDGLVQLEVGAGMVIREKANPVRGGAGDDFYYINNPSTGFEASLLKNRTVRYFGVYRDNVLDKSWLYGAAIVSSGYTQKEAAGQYDPAAAYTVTYLPLDLYLLTGSVQAIDGEYSANLKTTVDTLAHSQADVLTRVSVLESQKAGKEQPQWITPTLLNGAVNQSDNFESAAYYKDPSGLVHIKGLIIPAVVTPGTKLFTLPSGYRPAKRLLFLVMAGNGTGGIQAARIDILTDGIVQITAGGTASDTLNLGDINPFPVA